MMVMVLVCALAIVLLLAVEQLFRFIVKPKIREIFENVPPFNVQPEPEHPAAQLISFQTADGITLRGSILNADIPEPEGLVLFMPELRGNHWMASRYTAALIDEGYVILSFDFRNQGESESQPGYAPIHWLTEFEMKDVEAAFEFIESDDRLAELPVVVFGVSRGGVAALLTGCRYPKVCGVVADSAFGTMSMIRFFVDRFAQHVIPQWLFRLLPEWHITLTLRQAVNLSERRRQCRYVHLEAETSGLESKNVLLISGARDSYVTPEIARRLHAIVGTDAQLWIAPGAKHNMSRTVARDEYDRRVVAHVRRCIGRETQPALPSQRSAASHDETSEVLIAETISA